MNGVREGVVEIQFQIKENAIAEAIRRGEAPPSKLESIHVDLSELSPTDQELIAERSDDGWIYRLRSKKPGQRSDEIISAHEASLEGLMAAIRENEELVRQSDQCCEL